MRRLHGFSLMEMMIVLTIVAIVAAASAPMVNKKMVRAASEKSPWVFVSGESIGYNIDNENGIQDRKTATIGANGRVPNAGGNPRLYIDTNLDTTPHILFGRSSNNLMRLIAGGSGRNLWFSNQNIPAGLTSSVVLGQGAVTSTSDATAIGANVNISGDESVAIGRSANTTSDASVAIGERAQAGQDGISDTNRYAAIAIGSVSKATRTRAIAIGRHAEATATGAIAMGSSGNDVEATRARAMGISSIAIGQSALASKDNALAIGGTAQSTGVSSIAISGNAPSNNSIAIGWGANAASNNSLAFGYNARTGSGNVSGNQSGGKQVALGYGANATYYESTALGAGCAASNYRSTAIGSESKAYGTSSVALGRQAETAAAANDAVAIGTNAKASHYHSMAIGYNAKTTAANTIVLGDENTTVIVPGAIEFNSLHIKQDLVVDYNCVVNRLGGEFIFRAQPGPPSENSYSKSSQLSRIFMGDDKGGDDNTRTLAKYGWKYNIMGYTISSDRRLKNVNKEFTYSLDKLKKLEVFNYTFKDDKDKTPRVGVMAQDLQKIFPDAVMKGEDGFLRIRMEDMFYTVINAVKELDTRTTAQEKKIQELEKRIEELEKKIK